MLAAARPKGWEGGTGYDVSLKDALDHAATKIDEAFAGQPEREAKVRNTIGMTYWYLGQFDSANSYLEKAYRLRARVPRSGPSGYADQSAQPGLVAGPTGPVRRGGCPGREALEKRPRPRSGEPGYVGIAACLELRPEQAAPLRGSRSPDPAGGRGLPAHSRSRASAHAHGSTPFGRDLLPSEPMGRRHKLHRQVLEGRQRVLGPDHPDTLRCVANLGSALMDQGQLQDAEELIRQGFASRKRVLGAEHLETLWSQWDLADVLSRRGKYAAAEKLLRDGLEVCRRRFAPDHSDTLDYLALLGEVLCLRDRPDEAEPLLRECVALRHQFLLRTTRTPPRPAVCSAIAWPNGANSPSSAAPVSRL